MSGAHSLANTLDETFIHDVVHPAMPALLPCLVPLIAFQSGWVYFSLYLSMDSSQPCPSSRVLHSVKEEARRVIPENAFGA